MGNCALKNSSHKANSSASFAAGSSQDGSLENSAMDGFGSGPAKRNRRALITSARSVLKVQTDDLSQHYDLGKELGRGQFGVIRQCTDRFTGEEFACKSISKLKLTREQNVRDVRREIEILRLLSGHPNIVSLKGVYEDKAYVHIVMELCRGGELFAEIVKKGSYSEGEAAHLIRSLVEVVQYCNDMGIMHRDLKPENILFATSPSSPIKLIDFGLAVRFSPGQRFSGMVGSAYYIAPEILNGYYSHEVDMWSVGVIMYILLSGVPPFWEETDAGIFEEIKRGGVDFDSEPWPNVSIAAKDLILGLLRPDAKARLTPQHVLQHPWILRHAALPGKSSARETRGVNPVQISSPLQRIKDIDTWQDVEAVATGNQEQQLLSRRRLPVQLSSAASQDTEGVLIELPETLQARQSIPIESGPSIAADDAAATPFEASRPHEATPPLPGSPISPPDPPSSLAPSPSSTCAGQEPPSNAAKSSLSHLSLRSTQLITLEFPSQYHTRNLPSIKAADTIFMALLAIGSLVPRPIVGRKQARARHGHTYGVLNGQEEEDRALKSMTVHHTQARKLPWKLVEIRDEEEEEEEEEEDASYYKEPLAWGGSSHLHGFKNYPLIQIVF